MRFEFLTTVLMKSRVLWEVLLPRLADSNRRVVTSSLGSTIPEDLFLDVQFNSNKLTNQIQQFYKFIT